MAVLWISTSEQLKPELNYNLAYSLKGATHGHILLIIPFRVYYESFASMNLKAEKSPDGSYEFHFAGIPESGYMMRTSGFLGKTLVILAAHYDLNKALEIAENKLKLFDVPYYTRYIKRRKPFLFKIYSREENSIRFKRYYNGIHAAHYIHFPVLYEYHPEILNIDFNIYKILLEMSRAFNHSFLPEEGLSELINHPEREWRSPPLDYTGNINKIVRTAARIMKKLKRFKQERRFTLTYRLVDINKDQMTIRGSARPEVKVWGDYVIRQFTREVIFRRTDYKVVRDSLAMNIENPESRGLEASVTLRLLDHN